MSIDRPSNGAGGSIRGLELSYQQTLAYGFGIIANYTFVDGERDNIDHHLKNKVPGTSKHSANLTAYYENNQFSTRLSYNYRTQFATGVGETIMDNYGQLDASLTIKLSHALDAQFEFINWADEHIYTFDRNEFAPTGVYVNGRRYYAGLRYQF